MTKNINMTMCWWADEATNLPACHRGENILSGHFVNLSMASEKSPQCLGLCSVFVLGVGRKAFQVVFWLFGKNSFVGFSQWPTFKHLGII